MLSFMDGENPQVGIRALGRGLSAVVDSERMVLCEEEVVTFIKKKIPLQLGKQVVEELLFVQELLFILLLLRLQ